MDRKKFAICGVVLTAAFGAVVGWSVSNGNALLPVIAVVAGVALLRLLKSRVDEVMEDERVERIGEKASRRSLQAFGLLAAMVGAILVTLGDDTGFEQAGFTLLYSVCLLLVLYMVFYGYYSRKYGG